MMKLDDRETSFPPSAGRGSAQPSEYRISENAGARAAPLRGLDDVCSHHSKISGTISARRIIHSGQRMGPAIGPG